MVISQTPLRIGIAGGGTDSADFYRREEGCVLNAAVDKFVYVIAKERFDNKIYLNYSQKEIVDSVEQIQHDLIREAMRKTGVAEGVEITTLADIPSEGSGLGSSGSITVGLLNALYIYQGVQVTAQTLAEEACNIEINVLDKPIGKQDQYIAAYGGIRLFQFHRDESVSVEKVSLGNSEILLLGSNLLLFYTDKTRKSDPILNRQRQNIEKKLESLRRMKGQALEACDLLSARDFDAVGRLLHQGWQYKKGLASGISNSEIDQMYQRALDAGALGGKISGAGGGGFLLLYVPREKQNAVRKALNQYRELPFFLEHDGSKIIFNTRRYQWK